MGIIQSTLNNFNKTHPEMKIDKKLKDITREDAELIYLKDYYQAYHIDRVENEGVAKVMFHMFVNSSPTPMAKIIQQSVN